MRFFNAVVLWLVCIAGLQAQISVVPTVVHLTSPSVPNAGSISLDVTGGVSPYNYSWNSGTFTTQNLASKPYGTYALKVKDSNADSVLRMYSIGYKAKWDQMSKCILRNDTLFGTNFNVDSWETAITKNTLTGGVDGWFEYVLRNMGEYKVIGFTDSLSPLVSVIQDIDHGFYYELGTLYRIAGGHLAPLLYNVQEGTLLRLERRGDTVEYKVNGNVLISGVYPNVGLKDWKVKGALYAGMSSSMLNVGCSFYQQGNTDFPNYNRLVPTIVHNTSTGGSDGSVRIEPLQPGTCTYTWQPGSVLSSSLSSVSAGMYSVTVADAQQHRNTLVYSVGYKVKWDQFYNAAESGDTIKATGPTFYGQAVSKNTLAAHTDGWVEYTLKDLNQNKFFGFSDSLSPMMGNYWDIDYGFYYEGSGSTSLIYGIAEGSFFFISTHAHYPEGTILRVERVGNVISLKINGVASFSGTDSDYAQKPLKIKAVLNNYLNGSLINLGCSFYQQGNTDFPNYNRLVPTIVHNTGTGASDGSVRVEPLQPGTCTYTWQPGSVVSSSVSSVSAGMYSVTVKDAQQHRNTLVYSVGYKVKWDQLYNAAESGDTIKATGPTVYGQAVSKNTLAAHTDGWMEYVLKDLNQNRFFGFTDSLSPMMGNYKDIDYGFYYEGSGANRLLYAMVAGQGYFISTNAAMPEGTIFRVERVGNAINLKINGVLSNSWIDSSYAKKPLKIKAVLQNYLNGSLVNLGCSFSQQGNTVFPNYTRLDPSVVHASSVGANDGSITVHTGITNPLSCFWQPGNLTTNPLENIAAGNYLLTVEDSLHHINSKYYHVGYKTHWDSLYGATVHGDTLKTTQAYMWGRAFTRNTLAAGTDGWFEYVLEDLDKIKYIGFLDSMSSDPQNVKDIDYGFYYDGETKGLYTFYKGSYGYAGYGIAGSILRVERTADTIRFTINGISLGYVVDTVEARKTWKIKGIVHGWANTKLVNVGCSFGYNSSMSVSPVITNVTEGATGSIELHISGGTPHYNIAWNGLQIQSNHDFFRSLDSTFTAVDSLSLYPKLDSLRRSQTLTNIPSAIYNNIIIDNGGDTLRETALLGNDFGWITGGGVSTSTCVIPAGAAGGFTVHYGMGQRLTKSAVGASLKFAVSDAVIHPQEREFYVEYRIPRDSDEMIIGLKIADSLNTDTTTDLIQNTMIHMRGNGTKSMRIYYNSELVHTLEYVSGDVMGILLNPNNNTIVYSKNFTPVWTQSSVPDAFFQANYQLKALLKTPLAQLGNIILVGPLLLSHGISATVTDVTCGSLSTGAITFSGYSMLRGEKLCSYTVSGPNGYSTSGTGSSATLSGLYAGVYTVSIQVRSGSCSGTILSPMVQTFTVAYMPDWINQAPFGATNVNTLDRSFNITATQSSPYTWLGGASTNNLLDAAEEGWAEFKPVFSGSSYNPFSNRAMAFGLTSQDLGTHPSGTDHRFYVASNIQLQTVGLGGNSSQSVGPYTASMFSLGTVGAILNVTPTDILKIRKVPLNGGLNMKMEFYKNNSLVGSGNATPSTELVVDVSVNQKDLYISKPRITFGCDKRIPNYFILKKVLDAGYYTSYRKSIYFAFEEEYFDLSQGAANSLSYTIVTDKNVPVTSVPGLVEVIGDNRYTIDLSTLGMTQGQFYRIAITNKKNEVFYARFKY